MRHWTTKEIIYLETNAELGVQEIAKALNRSVNAIKVQAHKRGISLRKRTICPRCGNMTFRPLNSRSGWCIECVKEMHYQELESQLKAMLTERKRAHLNNQARQRIYAAKYRHKKETSNHQRQHTDTTTKHTTATNL